MKQLLLLLVLFCTITCQATNYYVAANGNDNASGTLLAPWKTINKVNSAFSSFLGGDTIFFKKGDVFSGTLRITKSGAGSSRIVISAYGSGSLPVFSNFNTASGFTNNNSIWQTAVVTVTNPMLVEYNGQLQWMGRYPNIDSANGGYLTYESFTKISPYTITDNELPATPSWVNASMVKRPARWILDICTVTGQSGAVLTYTHPTGTENTYYGTAGFGYFFQNDLKTLNQNGEWYFDKATSKLYVFSNTTPNIRIAGRDTGIVLNGRKNISIENIRIEGNNKFGIWALNDTSVIIKNCQVVKNNTNVWLWNNNTSWVLQNVIDSALTNGIYSNKGTTVYVGYNQVSNTGIYPGMGESGDGKYIGIYVSTANSTIEYNTIYNSGHHGIHFDQNNVLVYRNYVTRFCTVKDDGGGIYTWSNNGNTAFTNRLVSQNIVMQGIGAPFGTNRPSWTQEEDVRGLYLDGGTTGVRYVQNTIVSVNGAGIFANFPKNCYVGYNNVFYTKYGVEYNVFPNMSKFQSDTFVGNQYFPVDTTGINARFWDGSLNYPTITTIENVMKGIGRVDSNIYRPDLNVQFDHYYHLTNGGTFIDPPPVGLSGWKTLTLEQKSIYNSFRATYNKSAVGSNTIANSTFDANINGVGSFSNLNNHVVSWDNTSKITGIGSLKIALSSSSNNYTSVYAPVGLLPDSRNYALSFKIKGSNMLGTAKVYLRLRTAPYSALAPIQYVYFDSTIRSVELLFRKPTTGDASYIFEISQQSGTVWLDDISFRQINISDTALAPFLAVNNTAKTVLYPFPNYKLSTLNNTLHDNVVPVGPYSSALIFKVAPITTTTVTQKVITNKIFKNKY